MHYSQFADYRLLIALFVETNKMGMIFGFDISIVIACAVPRLREYS